MHLFHHLAVASSLALSVSARALLVIPPESALAELSKLARLPIGGAVTAAAAATDDKHLLHVGPDAPEHHQLVKLDCPGCPFARQNEDGSRKWDKDVPNALIFDISVDNDNNEQLKVNNVLLYGKEIQASPIRAPQVEASVSLADVRSAVKKVAAAGDDASSSVTFPYPVVGLGFESNIRDAADPGQHADGHASIVTISIKVLSLEKQKVHGLPTVHARLFKTADGKLKIDRVDVEAAPAAAAEETTTSCTTLPVLCRWRALLLSRFRRVRTAVHHCIRCLCHRLRMGGLFKIRLHGFQIHPHGHHHFDHHHHHHHDQHKMVDAKQHHPSDPKWHNGVNTHNPFGPGSRPEPGSPAAKLLKFFDAYPKDAPSAATATTTTTTTGDADAADALAATAAIGLGAANNNEDDKHFAAAAAAGLFGLSYASFVVIYASLATSLACLLAAVGYVSLRQYCRMRAARRLGGRGGSASRAYVSLPGPVFLEESGPFGLTAKFAASPAAAPSAASAVVDVEAKPFLPAYVEDGDDEESAAEYRDEKME